MMLPKVKLIAGVKKESAGSVMTSSFYVFHWLCGIKKDPILKERIFGLTGNEGNHGEDAKEYYYFIDNTPRIHT